ncbi:B3 domain-containing protein Os02g0764100-like [Hevea brasiliensis]|uniref:B3 domain-containing protein Os02g0764100-like n=1 Tax=Hevea brasiliensis TaxID=3981 RepID=UPI0025DF39C0|nr:B3 domain-containing protein Os02g0764100-like [Hevea brasiliensis]
MPSSTASSPSNSSSSLPIFGKSLTKIDVEKKLSVPTKALTHLPSFGDGHHLYIEAKDDRGFFWSFQCSIRRNGHPKSILSSRTWLPFVRYRNLRVGDTIKLYKEYDQFSGVGYKIEVEMEN